MRTWSQIAKVSEPLTVESNSERERERQRERETDREKARQREREWRRHEKYHNPNCDRQIERNRGTEGWFQACRGSTR